MRLRIVERSGVCRWCGGQAPACTWANRPETVCTSCATFDQLMQTTAGRLEAVTLFNLARAVRRFESSAAAEVVRAETPSAYGLLPRGTWEVGE
jgi:hypothetical protein